MLIAPYSMSAVIGWINMTNLGRYGTDYNTRAFIAFAGLGALTSDDCVYPSGFVDGDGHALDAAYVIHFDIAPTLLEATGIPLPDTLGAVDDQGSRGFCTEPSPGPAMSSRLGPAR